MELIAWDRLLVVMKKLLYVFAWPNAVVMESYQDLLDIKRVTRLLGLGEGESTQHKWSPWQ